MLNYSDKSINILAIFVTLFIFVVIFSFDIWYFKNNARIQEMENKYTYINKSSNSSKLSYKSKKNNEYSNLVQKVGKLYSNENKEISNETEKVEVINNNTEINTANNNKIVDVSGVGSVNIYSTNKWRIKIPKLKLDAPIAEGTSQEAMRRTVGHFEETDKWTGNVALAAHNVGYRCNFFQDIKNLKSGDEIIYSTEKGERRYKVVLNKIIEETNWQYIKNTEDNRITLITCETNKRAYRRCIQAIECI